MKLLNYIIALVIIGAVVYLIVSYPKSNNSQVPIVRKNLPAQPKKNPYRDLRNQMLNIKPVDIKLALPGDKEVAFGVVLEFGTAEGTATIISLATGDASMYTSNGGGIIGGSEHENVRKAAIDFVETAQDFFIKMIPADTRLTKPGNIKFYILTNKGRYSYEAKESEFTQTGSQWDSLFYKGNVIIAQLRSASGE